MTNINMSLIALENLSKEISDNIFNDNFDKIFQLDMERKKIIENIKTTSFINSDVKDKLNSLIKDNNKMILISDTKIKKLKLNQNKFTKRLQAYNLSK